MTRDPSLALRFGAELAGCAQFDVIGEQPVVSWVRATLDNDTIRLQHEARHHAIFTTCGEQECDSGDDHNASVQAATRVNAEQSSAKRIDLFPISWLQENLRTTDLFPSQPGSRHSPKSDLCALLT